MPSSNVRVDEVARTKLPQAANVLAQAIRRNAPTARIKRNVEERQVVSPDPGVYQIDVVISIEQAPEAAAFEWGSGLNREIGAKRRYRINPKTASALAFKWDNPKNPSPPTYDKYLGEDKDGKKFFNYVDHPGIVARPYIRPAIKETIPQIRQILSTAFAIGIKSALVESFKDVE